MDSNSLYAFEKFGDTVFRAVFNSVGNYAEAEDITQEVFLKLHQNPQNFNDENHMKAWLLRVAFNKCRDFRKSFRFRKQCSFDDVNENMLCVEFTSDEKSLLAEISSLPEKYSSVIYLYYYEKYSVKEIAEILKKNENTVSSLLRRARNKLKDILGEEWIGDFSELGYNFCFFDIIDDERQKLSELFSSYKWVETDDNSWSIQRYGETNSEFKFYLYDENNRFITFMEKGFLIYQYSEGSDYLTKAYKIDYDYLKDEIYKILNIREIKNFSVLDDTDEVAEITCNGVLLEGKEKEALIECLAISVSDFAEVINVPDLSTANITKEIEYTDVKGINHNFTAYDSGYVIIDSKYYRSNALDFDINITN